MSLFFEKPIANRSTASRSPQRIVASGEPDAFVRSKPLEIAVVNNMPDAALLSTEKQFARLLSSSLPSCPVRVTFYSLPSVQRDGGAEARVSENYGCIDELMETSVDGLIVTGAEPRAAHLTEEPFWSDLAELTDWATSHTRSTIWSCLAAHAAVLHLDGIQRRRLAVKKSGIFACELAGPHWLTQDMVSPLTVSHSRWNELAQDDLDIAGYRCITTSQGAGVDIFAKSLESEFIFFQGHPEYDLRSLQYEYLRDFSRYLNCEQANVPTTPVNYFDAVTEAKLLQVQSHMQSSPDGRYHGERPSTQIRAGLEDQISFTAKGLFANWLQHLATT